MATIDRPFQYSADSFRAAMQQNVRLDLFAGDELRVSGVDGAACQEVADVLPAERLDAIKRLFNRILQPVDLCLDEMVTEGSLQYRVVREGEFTLQADRPLRIGVRPVDVAILFCSLFDPMRSERQLRFLPQQKVYFTDWNFRDVVPCSNVADVGFWFNAHLSRRIPNGFTCDIMAPGNLNVASSEDGIFRMKGDEGIIITIRRRSLQLAPAPVVLPPAAMDLQRFERPRQQGCVARLLSSISAFFSTLWRVLFCQCRAEPTVR